MAALSRHDRILRIFQNRPYDRPALKLWGYYPGMKTVHPAYDAVCQKAYELSDIFWPYEPAFHVYCGQNSRSAIRALPFQKIREGYLEQEILYQTPRGVLTQVDGFSLVSGHGYTKKFAVNEPEDLEAILAMPYEPEPFLLEDYLAQCRRLGSRGMVMISLEHAGYALHKLMGSENLAYFTVEHRDLLQYAVGVYAKRICDFVEGMFRQGLGPDTPFCWYGPEVLIPPLASYRDFDQFVCQADAPLCDLIHSRGGFVWVHCHNKTGCLLQKYIDLGVDVLNPLEPPPNGDVNLRESVARFGNRIGWEGNIEIQELISSPTERIQELLEQCVEAGAPSGRFILCPSSGFMEVQNPSQHYIENLLFYLEKGYELVNRYAAVD